MPKRFFFSIRWIETDEHLFCRQPDILSVSRSVVPDSATPWTAAHQAPLSMRFSRQGYCSGLPFPSLGDLPNPGIEPGSPALQADSLPTELQGKSLIYYLHVKGQLFCQLSAGERFSKNFSFLEIQYLNLS